MIVVDVNIIAYLMIESHMTASAQALFQKDSVWIAPMLWRHEFLNILATAIRAKEVSVEKALTIWQDAVRFMSDSEREIDPSTILEIVAKNKITAYDAQYIALAKTEGLVLVTEDKELLKKFPDETTSLTRFSLKGVG